ncbi:hypothetical protein NDU88_007510 [Pleurodeles waltl]|uniref:Uncharacterized protein n=1 Tax=Pleurodeles waltl TaxID=8319 RepID=A0AAV7N5K7_PLEWA|nr:hypothetical protein NDU88_007510 [Pleurodeles waltl]
MDPPRRGELCRSVFLKKDHKQALLAASRAVRVFGCCCGPGGTRLSPIVSRDRGGAQQDKEPSQKQTAPAEVPEKALQRGVKRCSPEVAQRSPTPPEDNLEGRAMQVTWTELLDSRDLARRAERRPRGPVMQFFGACGCRGTILSDPREISSELLVRRGGRLPPQHAPSGKQSRRRQDQRYRVAVVVFATLLQFCRFPARSAVDSLAEGEERDAEEVG